MAVKIDGDVVINSDLVISVVEIKSFVKILVESNNYIDL